MPLKKFFNTNELMYKPMELKDKLPGMGEDEILRLLAAEGMLVKRPLFVGDDFALVGFKEAEWESKLFEWRSSTECSSNKRPLKNYISIDKD